MMEPTAVEIRGSGYVFEHTCLECSETKTNRSAEADDRDAIVALAARTADSIARGRDPSAKP